MTRVTLSIVVINLLMMGSAGWAEEPAAPSGGQVPSAAGEPSSPPSQEYPAPQPAEAPQLAPPPPAGTPEGGAAGAAVQKALATPEEEKQKVELPPDQTLIKGRLQVELIETYAHLSSNQLYIQGFGILPILVIGPIQVETIRRDVLVTTFVARYKLTDALQATLNVPYQFTFNRTSTASGGQSGGATGSGTSPNVDMFTSNAALGDINGSLTYQALTEQLMQPSLFLSLGFKGRTGTDIFQTNDPSGSGYNSISLSANAVKTSDPAVLYGGVSYAYAMARRGVVYTPPGQHAVLVNFEPGDNIGLLFGVAYALNYKLTLSLQYQQGLNLTSMLDRKRLADSMTDAVSLRFGWVWKINDQASIDLSVTQGLTADAANAVVALRIPWRF